MSGHALPAGRSAPRAAAAVLIAVAAGVGLAGCSLWNSEEVLPYATCADPGDRLRVAVSTASELKQALAAAAPGMQIDLADGTYSGRFEASVVGSAEMPILLCGGADAVLDGGTHGYALHLENAGWWTVEGLTIRGGQKGVVLDATSDSALVDLTVSGSTQEAVHLRSASSRNILTGLDISRTGSEKPKFGEGVYIGSAESNWCTYSACEPDRSDNNSILNSTFGPGITAEAIDIKEGTTGGLVEGNTFTGDGQTDADSWVDVKGNGWTIRGNSGTNATKDGMQVHVIVDGWGQGNVFQGNTLDTNAEGYGIAVAAPNPEGTATVVGCSNTAPTARAGLSNIPCTN